jgi:hypothetical protein
MLGAMADRRYRLTVDGELSDHAGRAFEGMALKPRLEF